jgi:hypothetical protein
MTVYDPEKEVGLTGDVLNFPSATTSKSSLVLSKLRM